MRSTLTRSHPAALFFLQHAFTTPLLPINCLLSLLYPFLFPMAGKRAFKPLLFWCQRLKSDGRACNKGFKNRSGLTQHINAVHEVPQHAPPSCPLPSPSPPVHAELDFEAAAPSFQTSPSPPADVQRSATVPSITPHPILDGERIESESCSSQPQILT